MTDRLQDLLLHPDPDARRQALELARAAGVETIQALLQGLPLDARGTLWPPPSGWSPEVLTLLLDHPLPHVRGLILPDTEDGADDRLARVPDAFPALEHLDLSSSAVRDLAPLARLPALTALTLQGCTQVAGIEPLRTLRHLRVLDLSQTRVRDLAPLSHLPVLQSVNLEGCVLAGGLRALPPTVTTLRLRDGLLEERLVLEGRALEHLSVWSLDWIPARGYLPRLQTLALDRGTPEEVADWPVVRLWLRTPADVDRLPLLRWLQIEGDVQDMALPDGLAIVQPSTFSDMPPPAWWGARVCPPDTLRQLVDEAWAPLRAEADIFWRAEGFRTRLTLLEAPVAGRVPLVKQLRARFGGGLMERVQQADALLEGRMGWLTEARAAHLQAQLGAIGITTRREPM